MPSKTNTKSMNHLRAWRERARLTQTKLAELADTKPSVISELESGVMQLSDKWLRRLAPHLGTRPGFLLDFAPEDVDAQLLAAILEVPSDAKGQVLTIIQSFSKTK